MSSSLIRFNLGTSRVARERRARARGARSQTPRRWCARGAFGRFGSSLVAFELAARKRAGRPGPGLEAGARRWWRKSLDQFGSGAGEWRIKVSVQASTRIRGALAFGRSVSPSRRAKSSGAIESFALAAHCFACGWHRASGWQTRTKFKQTVGKLKTQNLRQPQPSRRMSFGRAGAAGARGSARARANERQVHLHISIRATELHTRSSGKLGACAVEPGENQGKQTNFKKAPRLVCAPLAPTSQTHQIDAAGLNSNPIRARSRANEQPQRASA